MPVDPVLLPFLPGPTIPDDVDFTALRAQEQASQAALIELAIEPGPEVAQRDIVTIPATGGSIEIVIYRPVLNELLPAHLYIHGGGWVGGSALSAIVDITARERTVGAHCVVVAVNYRKAPEHPFPIPLLDCQAALSWVVAHAEDYGVDRASISVGGHSAGANLAAALALKVRDEHGPDIAFLLLEVPALDLTLSLPSHSNPDLGTRYALHRSTMELVRRTYATSPIDAADPYASPLLASDHSRLPPTYIMSAEYDLLRDDGVAYARKLRDHGVPVTFSLQKGHVHHSSALTKILPGARQWRDELINVLKNTGAADAG
ncbi:alpha/beta hydrolase [uncultured Microbacterium sp.]|uniref:alpha/beta hydrolase n=1 Tax=uncultured Microbacterium sp. TaxID=191216 RepID=UPI0028EC19E8|nr:alpha/beta hydrolase [uncultured Microbacterium sp.]